MGMDFRGQVCTEKVLENYIFWSEIESGLGKLSHTPPLPSAELMWSTGGGGRG